jgi:hypothetical protein
MDTFFFLMIFFVDLQHPRVRGDASREARPLRERAFRAAIDHGGHDLAEPEDRVTRIEAIFERIFDRLDRIDARLTTIEGQLDTIGQQLDHLNGRIEQLPGRWTLLAVLLPISTGMFIGLMGAAWALFHLTTP